MFNHDKMLGQSILSIRNGEMATGILLALAKIKAGRNLTENDIDRLKEGNTFLDSVLEGYTWLDSPSITVTVQSCSNAYSFGTAASFWRFSIPQAHIKRDLEEMKAVLIQLPLEEHMDESLLKKVREFFGKILDESIEHAGYLPPHEPIQQLF